MGNMEKPLTWGLVIVLLGYLFVVNCECGEKIPHDINLNDNIIGSIITPDKDIIPNSENLEPAYIVFENYEKILQWNRSLRFGLAVCTLKEKFENVL